MKLDFYPSQLSSDLLRIKPGSPFLILILFLAAFNLEAATITSTATGNWSASAWPNTLRTGTITTSNASTTVTGTGTAFLTEISVGNIIKTTGNVIIGTVASITDNTTLILTGNAASTNSNIAFNFQGVGPIDAAVIAAGHTVTVDNNFSCASILFNGNTSGSISVSSGFTLNVTGGVSNLGSLINLTPNYTVSGLGTMTCSSVTFSSTSAGSGSTETKTLSLSVSTLNVTGAISNTSNDRESTTINISSTNFNMSGSSITNNNASGGAAATNLTSTNVDYNGAAQTVYAASYTNLTLSNSGAKTMTGVTAVTGNFSMSGSTTATPVITSIGGNLTISGTAVMTTGAINTVTGSLTVGSGATLTLGGFAITIGSTSSITGTVNTVAAATGTKTFTGAVTINSGGTWNLSGQNPLTSFAGGITMNSTTFNNGTNTATFSVSQSLAGTGSMTFGTIDINSTIALTNSNTANVTAGVIDLNNNSSTFTQGLNSTLYLTAADPFLGSAGGATFDASTNSNWVNYSGTGQTVKIVAYQNLALSGSGNKTFATACTVSGTLSISGTAVALFANGTSHTASKLILGGIGRASGTWGGTTSAATNPNVTYFGSTTTGIVTVGTNCSAIDASNLTAPSATGVCGGTGSVVTVNSSTLTDATYTVTYNVSGTNTVATTTASMVFAAGTGTFTTSNLATAGSSNVVNITVISTSTGCSVPVSVSTPTFTTTAFPTITASSTATTVCYSAGAQTTPLSYSATTGSPTLYSINFDATAEAQGFVDVTNAALPVSPITINIAAGAAGGTYNASLTVSDGSCSSPSSAFTVTVNRPTITLAAAIVCFNAGAQTSSLGYTATSGTPTTYSITWDVSPVNSFVAVVDAALPTSPIVISVPAGTPVGTYTGYLTVKNASACVSAINSFTVTVQASLPSNPISSATATSSCPGSGIRVTVNSSTLASGTYTVTYNIEGSGPGDVLAQTSTMTFSQGTGTGTFTTVTTYTAGSPASITITSISAGVSSPCSTTLSPSIVISNIAYVLPSPNTFTYFGTTTDTANPNGATININASGTAVGTYTVSYSITGPASLSGTSQFTLASSRKGTKSVGSFTTGQLSTPGTYTITITSIAYANATSCTHAPGGSATFTVVGVLATIASGSYDDGPTVWGASGTGPDFNSGAIAISAGHNVTVDGLFNAADTLKLDQLTIYGTLRIFSNEILQIFGDVNNSVPDITIGPNGKLILEASAGSLPGGTLIFTGNASHSGTVGGTLPLPVSGTAPYVHFNAGSIYKHQATTTEGSPPNAYWDATSSFNVVGYTTASGNFASTGWSQNLAGFTWNCPSQTGSINLNGLLGATPASAGTLQGNVNITSTGTAGTGILRLGNTTNYSLTIPGNLTVSGSARFSAGPSSGSGNTSVLNLANFIYGSTASSWLCEAGSSTVNVSTDIQLNSGSVFLSDGGGGTNNGATINLTGNVSIASGATLDASSSNSNRAGRLVFTNTDNVAKSHTFTSNGTVVGYVLYLIDDNQTVTAIDESILAGAGTFTMDAGSKFIVESTDAAGAIQTGATGASAGNLQVTGTRTIASGATIEYGRTTGPTTSKQYISSGHPSTLGVNCIINYSTGVDVSSTGTAVTIGGNLTLTAGDLTVAANDLTVGGNTSLPTSTYDVIINGSGTTGRNATFTGDVALTAGTIQVTSGATDSENATVTFSGDFTGTQNITFGGNNCNVSITGTSPATFSRSFPISASLTLESFTMNKTGGAVLNIPNALALTVGITGNSSPANGLFLTSGNMKVNAALTVVRTTQLTSGTLDFSGQTATLQENITSSATGLFLSSSGSTLVVNGTSSGITNNLYFSGSGNTLGSLTLNRSAAVTPHITLQNTLNISNGSGGGNLNLTDGEFNSQSFLSMGTGATITRTPDAAFATGSGTPGGGAYHVSYVTSPALSLTTGVETLGSLNNVTSNLPGGTATLNAAMTGTGALTISTGIFDCATFAVAMGSASIAGTLTAPADNSITLTGNFANDGTFNCAYNSGTLFTSSVIFNGTSIISGSATTEFNHLTLNGSGTLTVPSLIRVRRNITFGASSTFNHSNGNVELNGSTAQTITTDNSVAAQALPQTSGNAATMHFYTLTINKTGGAVNLLTNNSNPLKLGHLLDIQTATTVNTNGNLTLLSQTATTDLDARIGRVLNGGGINGTVNVQRFKDANLYEAHKYVGSPAVNVPVLAELWRLYKYDASLSQWLKTNENMNPGVGYAALSNSEDLRLTFTGAVTVGQFQWNSLPAGWNLIANPYPSAIRWPLVGGDTTQVPNTSKWVLNNVSNTIGITDNGVQGYPSYFRHLNADGSWGVGTIQNTVIAMGQAFWVYVGAGGGSITVKERAKVIDSYGTGQFYRQRGDIEPEQLIISINNGKVQDQSVLKLDAKATDANEFDMDLPKLWNEKMDVFLVNQDKGEMLIHAVAALQNDRDIPVGVKVSMAGDYEFQFTSTSTFRYNQTLYLVDLLEGTSVPVSAGERYSFTMPTANKSVTNRFFLTLNPERKLMGDAVISVFPNPVQTKLTVEAYGSRQTQVTLLDLNGHVLSITDFRGTETLDVSALPAGMYVLKVKTDKGIHTHKFVKQ